MQGVGGGVKLPHIAARTKQSDVVVLNETNKHPGDEGSFKSLGTDFCRITNTPAGPDRTGPGFGTYLSMRDMDADAGDHIRVHDRFEIGAVTRKICDITLQCVRVYWAQSFRL